MTDLNLNLLGSERLSDIIDEGILASIYPVTGIYIDLPSLGENIREALKLKEVKLDKVYQEINKILENSKIKTSLCLNGDTIRIDFVIKLND